LRRAALARRPRNAPVLEELRLQGVRVIFILQLAGVPASPATDCAAIHLPNILRCPDEKSHALGYEDANSFFRAFHE
jgi:hypothetical protein